MADESLKKPKKVRQRRRQGEGSVFQRKDGRWVAQVFLPDGAKKEVYRKTEKDAEAARKQMVRDLEAGKLIVVKDQSLATWLEYWLSIKKTQLEITTYTSYYRLADSYILPTLGKVKLQKLTVAQVQGLYIDLSKHGLAPATIRLVHVVLSGALALAVKQKRITFNPCAATERPRVEQAEVEPLDSVQAQALLNEVHGTSLEALISLVIALALRGGEARSLRWSDVDFEQKSVFIGSTVAYTPLERGGKHEYLRKKPKSKSSRRKLALPDFVVSDLREHYDRQQEARLKAGAMWEDNDLVFPNTLGKFLARTTFAEQLDRALERAGLPHVAIHHLRHSGASILVSKGVPLKVIQELLGHTTINQTLRYARLSPKAKGQAASTMDDIFGDDSQDQKEIE